jgi:hypothetical protein
MLSRLTLVQQDKNRPKVQSVEPPKRVSFLICIEEQNPVHRLAGFLEVISVSERSLAGTFRDPYDLVHGEVYRQLFRQ